MFSREFAFCPFINFACLICMWMHAHTDEIRKRQFSEVPKWGNRRRWDLNLGQFGENGEGGGWGGGGGLGLVLG